VTLRARTLLLLLVGGASACATPGQVRRIETQLAVQQREQERRDSANAAMLAQIILIQRATIDSLENARLQMSRAKGESSQETLDLQRKILNLQEQLGQQNQRINDFLAQLDARQAIAAQPPAAADSGAVPADSAPAAAAGATPTAVQMLEAGNTQLRRGAYATARAAFQQLLVTHPLSPLVPDALFGMAETYATTNPDSAMAYYREVANNYADSPKAASAMWKLGDRAQRAGDLAGAKQWFTRIVDDRYRGTAEYDLARERLRQLP